MGWADRPVAPRWPVVLDGALGTLLEHRGVATPAPLWSTAAVRDAPEALAAIHRAYADAGATVHTAATFRASPTAAGGDAAALARAAVAIARASVPAGHLVGASLAPVYDCWRPDLSPPDAFDRHRHTADLLASAGADLLIVETFPHVGEAEAATRAAAATGLPVWASLTPGFRGDLLRPDEVAVGAARLRDAGASVVAVNCLPARAAGPYVAVLARLGAPWGIWANAGAPDLRHGAPGAATTWSALASGWLRAGASVIGGCCGTGPEHVAVVQRLVSSRGSESP